MTANPKLRESVYWWSNNDWWIYNKKTGKIELTEKAPERAVKSFELWCRNNHRTLEEHDEILDSKEYMYWCFNKDWWNYNGKTGKIELSEKAPLEAAESFKKWNSFLKKGK